jgi:hypothetical protein
MPYIGNTAGNRFVASKTATQFSGDGSAVDFTLDHSVGSPEDILVSVDGVIQEPTVAYGIVSGTTLRFTAAPSSNSGNNIFVYYLFRTVATVDHPATSALNATSGTFSTTLGVTGVTTLGSTLSATKISTGTTDNPNSSPLYIRCATDDNIRIGQETHASIGAVNNAANAFVDLKIDASNLSLNSQSAGFVTMPNQPAFMVFASGQSNLSLNAGTTITFGTPIFDQGSDFASNTFTAPVTGKYQLNLVARLDSLDDATQYYQSKIITSNREYQNIHGNSGYDADVNYMNLNFSVVADMDASDTATAQFYAPSLGSAQVDLNAQTMFSGFLVC